MKTLSLQEIEPFLLSSTADNKLISYKEVVKPYFL